MQMNNFQQAIEVLNEEGYSILQIQVNTEEYLFFFVFRFQESFFNTASSVDFNTVEGINVTDFLSHNVSSANNRVNFLAAFEKILAEKNVTRLTFSKNVIWYKWDAANVSKKIF